MGCTNKTRVRAGGRSQSATDKTTTQTYFTELVLLFTLRQVGKRERVRRDGMGWGDRIGENVSVGMMIA